MAAELRWAHVRLVANAGAADIETLELPGIVGQAYRVRCIRVTMEISVNTPVNAVGGVDVALHHQTDITTVLTVLSQYAALPWYAISVAPGNLGEWFPEDANVLLAGPQAASYANGTNATHGVYLSLGYEVVSLPVQAWSLLKNRTSFEGEK